MSEEPFIICPTPSPEGQAAAIICGHAVIQALGVEGMTDFHGFVQEVLATTIPRDRSSVTIPRAQLEALEAALQPFASIGQWMFARDLPDDTPVVQIVHIHGKTTALTRGNFKAAHAALRAAGIQTEGGDS